MNFFPNEPVPPVTIITAPSNIYKSSESDLIRSYSLVMFYKILRHCIADKFDRKGQELDDHVQLQ